MAFKMRDRVRDTISGFQGVVIARHEYVNGCVRYSVAADRLQDGKLIDDVAFDEQVLELVEAAPSREPEPLRGGPRHTPGRSFKP